MEKIMDFQPHFIADDFYINIFYKIVVVVRSVDSVENARKPVYFNGLSCGKNVENPGKYQRFL